MQDIQREFNKIYFTDQVTTELNFKKELRVPFVQKVVGKTFRAKGVAWTKVEECDSTWLTQRCLIRLSRQ